MGPKLNSCKYLRACVDETMRMCPSVGSSLLREVQKGGAMVDGEFIPAGCDVGTPIYSIQHSAEYFSNPFTFCPERWIVGERVSGASFECLCAVLFGTKRLRWKRHGNDGDDAHDGSGAVQVGLEDCQGRFGRGMPDAEWGRHRPNEFQLKDHVTAARDGPMLHFRERAI